MLEDTPVPAMLRAIWERSLPLMRERLDQLDATAAAASSGNLADSERELALSNAHKLAGSLGMFGYPEGSKIGREIEVHLEAHAETGSIIDGQILSQQASRLRALLKL